MTYVKVKTYKQRLVSSTAIPMMESVLKRIEKYSTGVVILLVNLASYSSCALHPTASKNYKFVSLTINYNIYVSADAVEYLSNFH